ncbi:MAG: hypothetical protein M3Y87_35270 [Myxococcota bacterium]|nr:hypothetical protein [Myxococcota bacterium]
MSLARLAAIAMLAMTAALARPLETRAQDPADAAQGAGERAEDGGDAAEDGGDTAEDAGDTAQDSGEAPPLLETHRRTPDYDALPVPGPDAGEVLLWIPRVALAPVTLTLEYAVRRPIGALVTVAEREGWMLQLADAFTWNGRRSGVVPTFILAYGLQPGVGLVVFSNDDVARGHSIHASAGFGGVDAFNGAASYTIFTSGNRVRVELRGEGARRPDRVFSDIGWNTVEAQYRFRETWYAASLALIADFWRESRLSVRAGFDGHELDANGYAAFSDAPSLAEGIQTGRVLAPYGLASGYAAYRQRLELAIDSREPEPAPGHGFRIEAYGELAFDPGDPVARRWVRYGATAGAFVDVGDRRVIGLWGLARFADPLGSEPLVFTELVALGQESLLMQGFLRGQLRGRSAVAATLEYVYPVWTHLDGRVHLSTGNVFGEHLSDFRPERLRFSLGLGLATAGEPDSAFQITVAVGSAPLIRGASIESVQLVIGSRQGI